MLATRDLARTYAPAIATNSSTNVKRNLIVAYLQQTTAGVEVWARRYSGTSFQAPQMVASAVPTIDSTAPPSVTLDDGAVATVAWAAATGTQFNVQVNSAGAGAVWPLPPTSIETDNQAALDMGPSQAPMPTARGDGKGNVTLIWRKRAPGTARFDLFARRFAAGAWGTESKIEAIDMSNNAVASVFNPVLASSVPRGSGVAAAAWTYGGTGVALDVYANILR